MNHADSYQKGVLGGLFSGRVWASESKRVDVRKHALKLCSYMRIVRLQQRLGFNVSKLEAELQRAISPWKLDQPFDLSICSDHLRSLLTVAKEVGPEWTNLLRVTLLSRQTWLSEVTIMRDFAAPESYVSYSASEFEAKRWKYFNPSPSPPCDPTSELIKMVDALDKEKQTILNTAHLRFKLHPPTTSGSNSSFFLLIRTKITQTKPPWNRNLLNCNAPLFLRDLLRPQPHRPIKNLSPQQCVPP